MAFDNTVTNIEQMHATLMNAIDPDLSGFFARSGKFSNTWLGPISRSRL